MIKEDYVSFEIAKLLKEKGFNANLYTYWYDDESGQEAAWYRELYKNDNWNSEQFKYSAPTFQMTMKWLRENYNLHCDIGYDDLDWFWNIISIAKDIPFEERPKIIKEGFACNKTYEEACEAAIRYCLENLI